ncbi:MAG: DUF2807 domain-containing protein [Flaviramulus sp.]|nr:DUF2807 domain-containing protein [Flaviramulus sp.]NNC49443.1 DUF2807 domain-containing protein [Flaviramulus sp.]
MKKYLIHIVLCIVVNAVGFSQSAEKVKGNRNVIIQQTNITSFHTIALDEDFEIEIVYNKNPLVEIETDENLHELIEFQVIDSVLTFNKTAKITSKKRLKITVTYDDILQHIVASEDAEIQSLATMNIENGTLETRGSSKVGLTIKSDDFDFKGHDKSRVKLNLTANVCNINLSGSCKLEALINVPNFKATLYQRTNANIEGSSVDAQLELDNNSQFNGKNFTIKNCAVLCEINSDATLEVLENITIDASGSSSVYLYENPKITITKLSDTSKLQKKVK